MFACAAGLRCSAPIVNGSTKRLLLPVLAALSIHRHDIVVAIRKQRWKCCLLALPYDQHRVCVWLMDTHIGVIHQRSIHAAQVLLGSHKRCVPL